MFPEGYHLYSNKLMIFINRNLNNDKKWVAIDEFNNYYYASSYFEVIEKRKQKKNGEYIQQKLDL